MAEGVAHERGRAARAKAAAFEQYARDYIQSQAARWSASNTEEWSATLANHVFPVLGKLPVASIDTQLVRRAIDPVWAKSAEQGKRVLNRVRTVVDAAAAAGFRDASIPNPARWTGHLQLLLPAAAKGEKKRRFGSP